MGSARVTVPGACRVPAQVTCSDVATYDQIGGGYGRLRQSDPRIASQIRAALGSATTVVNVEAGAGSYEPTDLAVLAVEPSMVMIRQRPAASDPVIRAGAESLPFSDGSFESGLALLTIHHWNDLRQGLSELRRVVDGTIAVLTWDKVVFDTYWMVDEYIPAPRSLERSLPVPAVIAELLGGGTVHRVLVPADCSDGFLAAWWRRPEAYLDPSVRAAISGLARLTADELDPGINRLREDLASGAWEQRHHELRALDEYDAGYRLVVSCSPSC